MKILLWAPLGAGTHYWGPGTSAFRLYKNIEAGNHIEVTLVHASSKQGFFPSVFKEQIKLGTLENSNFVQKLIYYFNAYKWIKKNYKNYDVVHGLTAFDYTFRPLMIFEKYGVPTFIKITSENGGFGENSLLSKVLGISKWRKNNANSITGYISISKAISDNLMKHGILNNKIHSIPNGVDVELFKVVSLNEKVELRKKFNIRNTFTLLYVGGLTHRKRITETVKAVNETIRKGFDIQFYIVGPDRSKGIVEKEISHFIEDNNIQKNIIRVIETNTPEEYYKIADLFVLVSKKEGMSNALLEAMSCGLPCLVTNISGSQELISNGINGYFCDGSIIDIARKLEILLKDKNLNELGLNSRTIIERDYSSLQVLSKHLELFNKEIIERNEIK